MQACRKSRDLIMPWLELVWKQKISPVFCLGRPYFNSSARFPCLHIWRDRVLVGLRASHKTNPSNLSNKEKSGTYG